MDLKSKIIRTTCSLGLFFSVSSYSSPVSYQNVGQITQLYGTVTFLDYRSGQKVETVTNAHKIRTEGSYLIHEESFLTVKIIGGNWLRMSPKSKFALEYDPKNKTLSVFLFSGSIKALISNELNGNSLERLIIKGGNLEATAYEAKFTISRTPFMDIMSVTVEKGMVTVIKGDEVEYLHSNERITLNEKSIKMEKVEKISPQNIKQAKGKFYLKNINKKGPKY